MTKVIGQGQVPGKGVSEGVVKFQNFEEAVSFDNVKVTVGQRAHVGSGLTNR